MVANQTARFSINPMWSHILAIIQNGRYLVENPDRVIAIVLVYHINKSKELEVYDDANFTGGWNSMDADNADNVLSRIGYIIIYIGSPIIGGSKLKTEIALSTAEAQYILMSNS